jgi:hypothetical protein
VTKFTRDTVIDLIKEKGLRLERDIAYWKMSEFAFDAMLDLGFIDDIELQDDGTVEVETTSVEELLTDVTFLGKPIYLHNPPVVTHDPSAFDLVREAELTN